MKPRMAAILSVVGVLTAGSAAALVNTRVLEGTGTDDTAIAASPPASAGTGPTTVTVATTVPPVPTVSATPVATSGGVPETIAPGTAPAVSVTDAAPAPTAASGGGVYQLGDGGTATLSTDGDVLTIVSVDPATGWEVHKAENDSSHSVEIRLRTDDREVRFEASLLFGVVSTSLETDDD